MAGTTLARFRLSTIGGLGPGGQADDGEVEDYTVEIAPSPDLAVAISDSPDPVVEGGSLLYFVAVTNNGYHDATGVTLGNTLPPEVVFVGTTPSSPTCTEAGGVVTCDLGTLSAGSNTTVVVEVEVPLGEAGPLTDSASVTANEVDPVPGNDTDNEQTTVVDFATHVFSDGFEDGDFGDWIVVDSWPELRITG